MKKKTVWFSCSWSPH